MDLKLLECEDMDFIQRPQAMVQWQALKDNEP
jgi:hypothetical protein